MIRRAYFGTFAGLFLLLNFGLGLLHVLEVFPFFFTLFYPLFCLLPLLMAVVGWREKDSLKWPAVVVMLVAAAALLHWTVALLMRLDII